MNDRPAPSTAVTVRDIGEARALQKVEPIMPRTPREVGEFAAFLIETEIVPASYDSLQGKKKIGAIVIAIMKGMELGLPPLRALQSLYVVNGKPTLYGDEIPALLLHSGKLEWVKETYTGEGDALACTVSMKRVGNAEPFVRTFSIQDASRQRLLGKPGPWQHSRARMCMIRARSYCARDGFADVLAGLAIKEEAEDTMRSQGLEVQAFASLPATEDVDPLSDGNVIEAEFETQAEPIAWSEIDPEFPSVLVRPGENTPQAWRHYADALRDAIARASTPGLQITWWDLNKATLESASKKTAAWVREALPPEAEGEDVSGSAGVSASEAASGGNEGPTGL